MHKHQQYWQRGFNLWLNIIISYNKVYAQTIATCIGKTCSLEPN